MTTVAVPKTLRREKGGRLTGVRTWLGSRPGLARNVVTTLALFLVGLLVAVFIISQEQLILPWQHKTTIYAIFSDASAVASGQHQEVRVAGVHVGQIGSTSVTPGGQAKVGMDITDASLKVYANATALLQAKTPLNEMYISLSPGSPSAGLLKDGQSIPVAQTQSPVEIDQILQHIGPNQQNAQRILLSETNIALDNASRSIPGDLSSISANLTSLQPIATALATRQSEIKQLVTDLNRIGQAIGGNDVRLASLINGAQTTLTTLSNNSTALQQTLAALPGTTDALGSSLAKVQALSGQLNPFLDNLRAADGVLPGALNKLTDTLNQLKPVVDETAPVIDVGTPVVNATRALLVDANPSLANLTQITPLLNPITAYLAYDTPWLQGFFFHTASLGSLTVNTPNGRQQVVRAVVGSGSGTLNFLAPLCSNLGLSSGPGSAIQSVITQLPNTAPLPAASYLPKACGGTG